jgi:hypothetical protein
MSRHTVPISWNEVCVVCADYAADYVWRVFSCVVGIARSILSGLGVGLCLRQGGYQGCGKLGNSVCFYC